MFCSYSVHRRWYQCAVMFGSSNVHRRLCQLTVMCCSGNVHVLQRFVAVTSSQDCRLASYVMPETGLNQKIQARTWPKPETELKLLTAMKKRESNVDTKPYIQLFLSNKISVYNFAKLFCLYTK